MALEMLTSIKIKYIKRNEKESKETFAEKDKKDLAEK